jgi:hypothetical protein
MNESTKAVFLSYASQDADAANRIATTLREAGIEVWLDQSELRGGDAWDAAIRKQIKACTLFMPIISANTRARAEGYFRLEWKLAVDRSHLIAAERAFLLPVVIDDTRDDDALVPEKFREVQWTSLPEGDVPANFVERDVSAPVAGSGGLRTEGRQARRRSPRCPSDLHGRQRVLLGAAALIGLLAAGGAATFWMNTTERRDRFGGRAAVRERGR